MIRVQIELPDPPPDLGVRAHVTHCLRGLDLSLVHVRRVDCMPVLQESDT